MTSTEIEAGLSADPEDELVQVELDNAHKKRRTGRARIIATVASVLIIGGVFAFALPRIANYGEVWDVVQTLSWQWLVALVLATVLNLATYAPPLVAALPGICATCTPRASPSRRPRCRRSRRAAPPSAWRHRSRCCAPGASAAARVGLAVVVTGVWNQFVILGFPIIAVAGLVAEGGANRTLEIVAIVGLVIFAAIVVGVRRRALERAACAPDRRPRRPPRDLGQGARSTRRR